MVGVSWWQMLIGGIMSLFGGQIQAFEQVVSYARQSPTTVARASRAPRLEEVINLGSNLDHVLSTATAFIQRGILAFGTASSMGPSQVRVTPTQVPSSSRVMALACSSVESLAGQWPVRHLGRAG